MRLDDYLALALKGCSKKICAKHIAEGRVYIEDQRVLEPSYQCVLGAGIKVWYVDEVDERCLLKEPWHRLLVMNKPKNAGNYMTQPS